MPWGHPFLEHGFADAARPLLGVGIGQEREWTDLAGTMTFLAPGLKDARDVLGIRHIVAARAQSMALDRAPGHNRFADSDRADYQQRVDRVLEVVLRGLVALDPHAVLIVDAAVVPNHAIGVEQERFGRTSRPKSIGDALVEILEHGERQIPLLGECGNVDKRVLSAGVDGNELDTLVRVFR